MSFRSAVKVLGLILLELLDPSTCLLHEHLRKGTGSFEMFKSSRSWALWGRRKGGDSVSTSTIKQATSATKDTRSAPDPNIRPPAPPTENMPYLSFDPNDISSRMECVASSVEASSANMITQLKSKGFFQIDGFLGPEALGAMRREAKLLHSTGAMVPSQSTRWESGKQVPYYKHNVLATSLVGGSQYEVSPRLIEYTVALTKTLAPIIAAAFPDAPLSASSQANKLAVCLGDGSSYDKHVDNMGGGDLRKLTVLYYLNEDWAPEQGGCFRRFDNTDGFTDTEPIGDRLIGFWADKLVHAVTPSYAPSGHLHYRYALTVWFCVGDSSYISSDSASEAAHFPQLQSRV